jgi:hypothetical protein
MQLPPANRSLPFLQRLDRLLNELNVLLAAFAIGLACLDFIVFAAITLSDEVLRYRHDRGIIAFNVAPSSTELTVSAREAQ